MVQLSHPYITAGKTITLTIQMFVSKVTSFQFSCSVISHSLWPPGLQHTSFSVHHQLPELAQTHVYLVGDAIQPSHPLWSSSPPAFSFLQHQGLFQWVSSSHQVGQSIEASASAWVLLMNIHDWFPLELTGLISLQSKGLSRIFSNTTVQ